jgi:hypothetical protein
VLIEWLQRKVTLRQAEAEHTVVDVTWPEGRVFGCIHDDWKKLIGQMQESPEETWQRLVGFEGFAVVRQGEIIDFIITALN